ncbi:MAG: hypothetical protein V4501_11745 [Pseudomonadota bacterium]
MNNKPPIPKKSPPWLVVILYSATILIDWLFAYYVEIQPEIGNNSFSLLYPLFSIFYFEFCGIALVGIYLRRKWGFNLGNGMIVAGGIICSLSYLIGFRIYPWIDEVFILILIINLAVILTMTFYYFRHGMNAD